MEAANPSPAVLWRRFGADCGDRLSPVLVREVRQGLRGRAFRLVFVLSLSIASAVTIMSMARVLGARGEAPGGRELFQLYAGVLGVALHLFVPFTAFQSMAAEWEENTRDMMQLTRLTAGGIVFGKLAAALVQALVLISAFAPFIAVSFLLQGLSLESVITLLNGIMNKSLGATFVAVALASLGRNRMTRTVLLGVLGVYLLVGGMRGVFLGRMLTPGAFIGSTGLSLRWLLLGWLPTLFTAVFAFVVARNRFTHPEENRSTPLRLAVSAALLVLPIVHALGSYAGAGTLFVQRDDARFATLLLFGASLLFASEPLSLGRKHVHGVPSRPLLAALTTPWLPGGGRGLLYFLVHVVLLVGLWAVIGVEPRGGGSGAALRGSVLGFAYAGLFLALPAAFVSSEKMPGARRWSFALLALALPLGSTFGWAMLQMVGSSVADDFALVANPFLFITTVSEGSGRNYGVALVHVAALLAFLACLPRILRGVHEVQAASARRRMLVSGPVTAA